MAKLVAIVYPDQNRAGEVMADLPKLQREYLLELVDACWVNRDPANGKVKLHQAVNTTATGAASGAFWGTLVGLLFLNPLAGLAVGAAAGAVSGKLTDYGISDTFIKEVSEKLQPGSSALFVMLRTVTEDRALPELAKFGGHVLHSNLSAADEAKWNALLSGSAPATPPTPAA